MWSVLGPKSCWSELRLFRLPQSEHDFSNAQKLQTLLSYEGKKLSDRFVHGVNSSNRRIANIATTMSSSNVKHVMSHWASAVLHPVVVAVVKPCWLSHGGAKRKLRKISMCFETKKLLSIQVSPQVIKVSWINVQAASGSFRKPRNR